MKIHGTAKGGALATKDFGVAFGGAPAGCTGGDDILINTDGSREDGWAGDIIVQKVTGVADTCYNQIAIYINTAAGSGRLGVYDDVSGTPTNLLAETDSFTVTANYDWKDITEFTLPSNDFWIAFQLNNAAVRARGENPFSTGYSAMNHAFGVFADPYVNTYSGTVGISCKVGHT